MMVGSRYLDTGQSEREKTMEGIIQIGEKQIKMRASALVPRLYRFTFGRDMLQDMNTLEKAFRKCSELPEDATEQMKRDAQLSVLDLTIFENVAYIMARHADPDAVPTSMEDWLDGFEMFSVYEVLPQILQLWGLSNKTTAEPKKN